MHSKSAFVQLFKELIFFHFQDVETDT